MAVALLVMTMFAAGCGDGDDGGAGGTTPTEPTTTSEPTTTRPASALDPAVVMAGPSGVRVISPDGRSRSIVTEPAAVAFAIDADWVVFQGPDPDRDVHPPEAAGPVRVWVGDEVQALAADPDASNVRVLDAAMIDDAPLALVRERIGGVDPTDTFEELVQINLRDQTRTTIVRRPAWESAHSAARLLPNGDVIGLFSSEAQVTLARWSAANDEPTWTTEVGTDIAVDLALRSGEVTVIHPSFDPNQDFTPVLTITAHDPGTGDEQPAESIHIDDPDSDIDTGLFCRDWSDATTLVCGRSGGEPLVVSVEDGSFDRLPGEAGSVPTVARST